VTKKKSFQAPRPSDEHDRKLLADVEEHGWHVICVEEDEQGPGFAYSIGLFRTFQHPEVIVFGLAVSVMHPMVNAVGEGIRSGNRLQHLDESDEILEGYNVAFRQVEQKHYAEYLGYARWFYGGNGFPVLQCVWPDKRHRYPWHPDYPETLSRRQPVLSDDKSWPFHEGRNRAVFATKPVLDGHPILLVTHDTDGDWQFLCGRTNRTRDGRVVSLGCVFDKDPTVGEVADLPEGWRTSRPDKDAAWTRGKVSRSRGKRKG
jgi:hypothetical protein